jgi:FtsP/CotA-like multicopper oxidase with cupredoxin domain
MTKRMVHFCLLVGSMLVAMLCTEASAFAQVTATASSTAASVPPVANPCPRLAPGSVVHQTAALFSQNGVLSVQFSYQTTSDAAGRNLFCFMTPSGLENPTLHVNPGDHLIITVTNNTPKMPVEMTIDPPNCGPGGSQMTMSSVNIHYHGTNTSPTCHSDEVIKTLINSGQTFQYNVAFPTNEPPGLYWYHPHVHGNAEHAVLGGAAGALVVDGIEDVQPAVSGLRHRIIVLRDQPTVQSLQTPPINESPGGTPNGVPFQDLTVNNITTNTFTDANGNTSYTPAVLHMEPGEKQFWRVSNSTSDTILDLQVQFDGLPQTFQVVAVDGVTVNSQDGTQPGGLIALNHFRLPPASRVEILVNAPSASVKLAQLVTLNILTGTNGDDDPNRPIFTIQLLADDEDEPTTDDRVGQFTAMNPNQKRFAGLATAPIAAKRVVFFNEIQPTSFFMDVQGQPEHIFDPNAPPAITATQGTVEEWTVENHTLENHEFHFHQVHFLVESQNNFKINGDVLPPGILGQYLDMIEVPNWDGNTAHPFPSVTLRIDFRGPDIGTFVFHCHILNHEDLGMMNIVQVVAADSANHNPAKKVPASGSVAGVAKSTGTSKASPAAPAASPGTDKMKMN